MPMAFTIDGLSSEAYPPRQPPANIPANVAGVLGMVRWASGAGFKDAASDWMAATIDDKLLPIKIGLIAVGGIALVTLLTLLAGAGKKG